MKQMSSAYEVTKKEEKTCKLALDLPWSRHHILLFLIMYIKNLDCKNTLSESPSHLPSYPIRALATEFLSSKLSPRGVNFWSRGKVILSATKILVIHGKGPVNISHPVEAAYFLW